MVGIEECVWCSRQAREASFRVLSRAYTRAGESRTAKWSDFYCRPERSGDPREDGSSRSVKFLDFFAIGQPETRRDDEVAPHSEGLDYHAGHGHESQVTENRVRPVYTASSPSPTWLATSSFYPSPTTRSSFFAFHGTLPPFPPWFSLSLSSLSPFLFH